MSKEPQKDPVVTQVEPASEKPQAAQKTEAPPNQATDTVDLTSLKDPNFARIVDDLVEFLSQRRRAFLVGAGCSKCVGFPLMDELTPRVLDKLPKDTKSRCILMALAKNFQGANRCNIEDYMSELVDHLSVLNRRHQRGLTKATASLDREDYTKGELLVALNDIKDAIAMCMTPYNVPMQMHRRFVRAIHGKLQMGKSGPSPCVDYFLLNYDPLFEDALALERITFADGFDGGATGWWNPSVYDTSSVCARVFKIHGSIDWRLWKDEQLPRRIRDGISTEDCAKRVMLWPASTKYRETQRDPYAQMIGMMRRTLRPEARSEAVLAICGYGFGDSHIDVEIEQALRESDQRLTVMVFANCDHPEGIVADWHKDRDIRDQVQIYAKRGFFHGDNVQLSEQDLPWWRFEVLGRLLGGER